MATSRSRAVLSNKQRIKPIQRRHLFGGAFFYRQSRINPLFLAHNVTHRDHIDTASRSDRAFRQRKAQTTLSVWSISKATVTNRLRMITTRTARSTLPYFVLRPAITSHFEVRTAPLTPHIGARLATSRLVHRRSRLTLLLLMRQHSVRCCHFALQNLRIRLSFVHESTYGSRLRVRRLWPFR